MFVKADYSQQATAQGLLGLERLFQLRNPLFRSGGNANDLRFGRLRYPSQVQFAIIEKENDIGRLPLEIFFDLNLDGLNGVPRIQH